MSAAADCGRASRFGRVARAVCHALLAAALLGAAPARAQEGTYPEAAVKAAFLYHFGTYIEWPPSDAATGITIAVLGDDGVFEHLAEYLPGRTIAELPVTARAIASVDELGDEQIVFFGRGHQGRLEALVADAMAPGRLIVTDWLNLIAGAAINVFVLDNRVRFEISREAATAADLVVSSRLLSAAYRVEGLPPD